MIKRVRYVWRDPRYWRYLPGLYWLYLHVIPEKKCLSCGKRRRHTEECYFA